MLNNGYQVRILSRDRSQTDELKGLAIETFCCDIRNEEAVKNALKGIDFIVHAAAAQEGEWRIFEQITINGTERIFRLAKENNIKRLVYISSMSVYQMDGVRPHTPLTEDSPLESNPVKRGNYTASKLAAEKIAHAYLNHEESGLQTVILRPATIYGPGGNLFSSMIGISIFNKIFIVLGNKGMKLPFVFIDNLVDATLLSLKHEKASGNIFNVIDDQTITKEHYIKKYIKKLYTYSIACFLPFRFVSKLVMMQESFFKIIGKNPILTRYRLNSASNNLEFSNNKIKKVLGWKSAVSMQEGLKKVFSDSGINP